MKHESAKGRERTGHGNSLRRDSTCPSLRYIRKVGPHKAGMVQTVPLLYVTTDMHVSVTRKCYAGSTLG